MTIIDLRRRPTRPVWIFDDTAGHWHVLRCATEAAIVGALCLRWFAPDTVAVRTARPHNTCPACETELAVGTPGAAIAVDPARAPTVDLRGSRPPVDPAAAWDSPAWDPPSADSDVTEPRALLEMEDLR